MNSDLISRSEAEKLGATCLAKRNKNGQLEAIISLDNAPTVEVLEPQGEYKTACNVLLSLEQIVRNSDGWEDSAVEAVHNAVQTAIKCMHERPQGKWVDTGDMQEYWAEEYQCSICGAKDHWHNFCPHCGAEMEKGGEEE